MNEITITIDGKSIRAQEGETLLNIARANGIYIPAICYLTRCSPTLACRLCLVDADGKRAYSCNAKAKEGMVVTTVNEEILAERKAIMQVYDINHPLQCGVCDKSGECELQDNTMFQRIDSQEYAIKDCERQPKDWGRTKYDPALCIVCERCVTVCKDMTGDNALSTVPRGGDPLPEGYKETMPKDAYTIWNKMNKSLIGKNDDKCTDCGECAAVCPTGALVFTHFQYASNAWELTMVPSSCAHCSSACHLWYEVKHASIDNPVPTIYRVKNDFHFQTLCGAGRFGYDYANSGAKRDESAFDRAVAAIKKAGTIAFTSQITNEEALMLQRLKEKLGVKLVNPEARAFGKFMAAFSQTSGSSLYKGSKPGLHSSDFAVVLGTRLSTDNPVVRFGVANIANVNKGAAIVFHPAGDTQVETMHKNVLGVRHDAGREEAVLYWLLDRFADHEKLPKAVRDYVEGFKVCQLQTIEESVTETVIKEDGTEEKIVKKVPKQVEVKTSRLCEEFGAYFSADTREAIEKLLAKKERFTLIAGADLFTHPRAENIARLLGLLERCSAFEVLMVPEKVNTLGVSLICDLDDKTEGFTVGYNVKGDFELTALGAQGENALDMPAMNQQEGTVTGLDKRVVPLNAALPYGGYTLGELANALGVTVRHTIDFTAELPVDKGFKKIAFDALENRFDASGEERRGYLLEARTAAASDAIEPIGATPALKKCVVYRANPIDQFNPFTAKSPVTADQAALLASDAFMMAQGLSEGDSVRVKTARGERTLTVKKEPWLEGEFALVPDFDNDTNLFGPEDYRFAEATISKG